jgi:hypothetical protein
MLSSLLGLAALGALLEGGFSRMSRPARLQALQIACSESSGPDPEDWRKFRASLVSGGLRVTSEEDGGGVVEQEQGPAARISVAPANEDLLKEQNEALWREYYAGGWAHASAVPEPGGLLCRRPLPAQLAWLMRNPAVPSAWGDTMRDKLRAGLPDVSDLPDSDGDDAAAARLSDQWASNTVYTYRLAEGLIGECLQSLPTSGGKLSVASLSEEQREMIAMYTAAQDAWQEVALVLDVSEADGAVATESLVINRPLAKAVNAPLAQLLLNGAAETRRGLPPLHDEAFLERFLQAFGDEAAIYLGGPDEQEASGTLVHGFALPGALEIAPGTGIYRGGVEAAVDAVLDGTRQPLEFRWFIGRRVKVRGPLRQPTVVLGLGEEVAPCSLVAAEPPHEARRPVAVEGAAEGAAKGAAAPRGLAMIRTDDLPHARPQVSTAFGSWCPVACARPLALKQCLGLPKPLWHEVLELCGGELAELSKLELLKRQDLEK